MGKTLGLKLKLLLSYLLIALGLLFVGATGFFTMRSVISGFDRVVQLSLLTTDVLTSLHEALGDLQSATMEMSGLGGSDAEAVKKSRKKLDDSGGKHDAAVSVLMGTGEISGLDKALIDSLGSNWATLFKAAKDAADMSESKKAGDKAKFQKFLQGEFSTAIVTYNRELGKIVEQHNKRADTWVKDANGVAKRGNVLSLSLVVIGFLLAIGVGMATTRWLGSILGGVSERLKEGASWITQVSSEVTSTSDALTHTAVDHSSALTETATSIEEMTAMVGRNSANAAKASEAMIDNHRKVEEGMKVVKTVIAAMSEIEKSNQRLMDAVEENNREFQGIARLISDIGAKTQVINDIAFQTKLLSFNASVEAARAGEHGMGFAVVASEVGSLAQLSADSARDITAILTQSAQRVEAAAVGTKNRIEEVVNVGRAKIQAGCAVASTCETVLTEIHRRSTDVSLFAQEIADASREQSKGIDEIAQSMHKIEKIAEENSNLSRQSSEAAKNLTEQADVLRNVIQKVDDALSGNKAA